MSENEHKAMPYVDVGGFPILVPVKEQCCGCLACGAVCPKKTIFTKADEQGFSYPELDKTACIQCHMCLRACFYKA